MGFIFIFVLLFYSWNLDIASVTLNSLIDTLSSEDSAWITTSHPSYQIFNQSLSVVVYWSTPAFILGVHFFLTFLRLNLDHFTLDQLLLTTDWLCFVTSRWTVDYMWYVMDGFWIGTYQRWFLMGVRCWVGSAKHRAEGDGEEEHHDNELGSLHFTSKKIYYQINSKYFQLLNYLNFLKAQDQQRISFDIN